MSSLRRGHANLLCIVPILVYVLPLSEHVLNMAGVSFIFVLSLRCAHLNDRCNASHACALVVSEGCVRRKFLWLKPVAFCEQILE